MKKMMIVAGMTVMLSVLANTASAGRVDGFTEPYRTVEVATTEVGTIREINVRQGDTVRKGDVVATLDDEVQQVLLSIAEKNRELQGRLESAVAERELRQQRFEKLQSLLEAGHARREEVARAQADLAIAEAQVLGAQEETAVRHLEYSKAAINLERREIVAPMDGIVSLTLKEEGEFVAPTDPHILHVVQIDRLLAVFAIPSIQADQISEDDVFDVALGGDVVKGTVELIAPLTDAESDTIRIKLRIENEEGDFRSGQRCSLLLPDQPTQTP